MVSELLRIANSVRQATDKSLAVEIREKLLQAIQEAIPGGFFEDKLYDTHEAGKGFREGFVSFALKPVIWSNNGLNGGILIRGDYPSTVVKSTAPESGTPEYKEWVRNGGNAELSGGDVETINLQGGFYVKKAGGHFQDEVDLGTATFTIDSTETIETMELDDKSQFVQGIEELVEKIAKNPPDIAVGAQRRHRDNQYATVGAFLRFLGNEERRHFSERELRTLAHSVGQNMNTLRTRLEKRGYNLR